MVLIFFLLQTRKWSKAKRRGWYIKRCEAIWTTCTICRGHRIHCTCYPVQLITQPSCGMLSEARTKHFYVITRDSCKALHLIRRISFWWHCPPIVIYAYSMQIHWNRSVDWTNPLTQWTNRRHCTINKCDCFTTIHCKHSIEGWHSRRTVNWCKWLYWAKCPKSTMLVYYYLIGFVQIESYQRVCAMWSHHRSDQMVQPRKQSKANRCTQHTSSVVIRPNGRRICSIHSVVFHFELIVRFYWK